MVWLVASNVPQSRCLVCNQNPKHFSAAPQLGVTQLGVRSCNPTFHSLATVSKSMT